MAMSIYTASDERWCFAEQTTWGNDVSDASASTGILTEGFGVNSAINYRAPVRGKAQRYMFDDDQQADQKGVVYQTEGMAFPVTTDTIDLPLYGVFQGVTEGTNAGGVYKTYAFPQTQPDFTNNSGKYFSLWQLDSQTSDGKKMWDAIVSELVLSCAPGSNEGILWAQPTFISRSHEDGNAYIGTVTYPTLSSTTQKYFYDIDSCQVESTDVILGDNGFTLTLRNNAKKLGFDGGKFETFVLPRFDAELSMQILWDSTARSVISQAKTGGTISVSVTWDNILTDGGFLITFNGKCPDAQSIEHTLDGNFVTLNLTAGGNYGGTEPCQISVVNQTNRGW